MLNELPYHKRTLAFSAYLPNKDVRTLASRYWVQGTYPLVLVLVQTIITWRLFEPQSGLNNVRAHIVHHGLVRSVRLRGHLATYDEVHDFYVTGRVVELWRQNYKEQSCQTMMRTTVVLFFRNTLQVLLQYGVSSRVTRCHRNVTQKVT